MKEPDLIVGMVDEEGRFVSFCEESRALETWLSAEERLCLEEDEAESFQLYLPAAREFAFAYGAAWRDVWAWDDRDIWVRRRSNA